MRLFFTGSEAGRSQVPFLLDDSMRPISAANAWLRIHLKTPNTNIKRVVTGFANYKI
jgi:hypothetical protein